MMRVHESPDPAKVEALRQFLDSIDLHLAKGQVIRPKTFERVLQQAGNTPYDQMVNDLVLRCQSQAYYSGQNLGHFGLALPRYAHFTSPIRRYPDLLVHRGIRSVIRSGRKAEGVRRIEGAGPIPARRIFPYDIAAMTVFGEHCSMSERRADDATREVDAWLKCEYLQDHVGDSFDGVIAAVTSFGLFVELSDLYIEGLVHVTSLPGDYYNFDAAKQRLTGERTGRSYQLGGKVRVQVARVDLDDRKIDLEMVDARPPKKAGKPREEKEERRKGKGSGGKRKGPAKGKTGLRRRH